MHKGSMSLQNILMSWTKTNINSDISVGICQLFMDMTTFPTEFLNFLSEGLKIQQSNIFTQSEKKLLKLLLIISKWII